MPEVPSAEQILTTESKGRPLPLEPWVVAGFSRLWQTMKKQIKSTIDADKQAQHRTVQSEPASVRNRS